MNALDDPGRYPEIRARISGKRSLELLYRETYARYADCLTRCPAEGRVLDRIGRRVRAGSHRGDRDIRRSSVRGA
jgi:hypothetical protein